MTSVKVISAAIALVIMSPSVWAQSHPLTLRMSCHGVRELVSAHGAIVLNTGPTTYDRYIAGGGQCQQGEVPDPAWVPTADTPQCPIGYRCVTRTRPSGG